MKISIPLLLAVAAIPLWASAQESNAPIKVSTTIHSDGTQTILKTDPDNHTAESKTVDASQKVIKRTVYAMDDQGQYTSASVYDGNDRLVCKSVFTRDAANRVTQQVDTTPDDKPLRKLVFEYNGLGKLTRVRSFDAAGNETTPVAAKKQAPASRRR